MIFTGKAGKYTKESGGVLAHAGKTDRKLILLMDFLQIPLSLIFTRFLNIFSAVIPDLYSDRQSTTGEMTVRVIVLVIAIVLTGIGAAMSLNMRIVPNPGDGIVQAIADTIHKSVGIGTILAMIGVGRTIAVFNHFTYAKMKELAAVED